VTGVSDRGGPMRAAGQDRTPERWGTSRSVYTLFLLTVIYGLNRVDRGVFNLVLPLIKQEMALSDTMLGLLSGLFFTLFYSTLGIPIAWAADRWSRRNIIALGLAFWSVMTGLTGLAHSVVQLAIARFLLGAGEATGLAPSNSMIADVLSPNKRVIGTALIALGSPIAIMISFPLIGWMSQNYGWRPAFFLVGFPGILLALLFYLTVGEPPRGGSDLHFKREPKAISARQALRFLARSRSYLLLVIGAALISANIHAMETWIPSFMARVHGLGPQETGAYIGTIRGPLGIAGAIASALLAAKLGQSDERWRVRVPAIACLLLCPADLILLFGGAVTWKVGLGLDMFFSVAQAGPALALLLGIVKIRTRASATAFYLLIYQLSGTFLGPVGVGWLNDHVLAQLGTEALRYSLLVAPVTALLAGLVFWRIEHHYAADQAGALED
jgi:MFS family permease